MTGGASEKRETTPLLNRNLVLFIFSFVFGFGGYWATGKVPADIIEVPNRNLINT